MFIGTEHSSPSPATPTLSGRLLYRQVPPRPSPVIYTISVVSGNRLFVPSGVQLTLAGINIQNSGAPVASA